MSSRPSARSTTIGAFSAYVDICVKPCHTTAASRSTHAAWSSIERKLFGEQVFGGLPNLPVPVAPRSFERGVDVRPIERSEREHGAAPHRGLVGRRGQDGGQTGVVTDGTKGGDRCFASERVVVAGGDPAQLTHERGARWRHLAGGPRRHF